MQPITAKQWADALRSGKYEQGQGFLCRHNKFCCLGVLAEEAGVESTIETAISYFHFPLSVNVGEVSKSSSASSIPYKSQPLLVDLDLDKYAPDGGDEDGVPGVILVRLMAMNDTGNYTFNEIADYIEEQAALQGNS